MQRWQCSIYNGTTGHLFLRYNVEDIVAFTGLKLIIPKCFFSVEIRSSRTLVIEKPQLKKFSLQKYKHLYLIHT